MSGVRGVLSLLCLGTALSTAGLAADDKLPAHRDGLVLVKFRPDAAASPSLNAALLGLGANIAARTTGGTLILNVGSGRVSTVVDLLKKRSDVLFAEPDYASSPMGATQGGALAPGRAQTQTAMALAGSVPPNDTFVNIQWAAQNTGQTMNGTTGTVDADESSLSAWRVSTGGNSVVVAILDMGVQYSHPDLFTNIWTNPGIAGCAAGTHGYNVLTSTCDPMDDDTSYGGHGSHVAGIIGATGNNAAGVAGVNWTTTILPVKWVYYNDIGYTSDLLKAMDWVLQVKQAGVNVRIVNDSATWPGTAVSQALSDEIDVLGSYDILFVTAAGNTAQNNDTTPRYPCSYNRPNEICVAATDQQDKLWGSSNYGLNTVQLAAPGANIYSTKRLSNYDFISGTSMAAPQVSGTAALLLSMGYMSVSALRAAILAAVDPLPSLKNFVSTGGRLNVCKAVPGCLSGTTSTPVNTGLPVVNGQPQPGGVVSASTGIWSGLPSTYTYQWHRCDGSGLNCAPIAGATSVSYAMLATADSGATLKAAVTASNSFGSATAMSGPSAAVAGAATPFNIASTIANNSALGTPVTWQATPSQAVNFVQFYVDGVLAQTDSASTYVYNQGASGKFDPATLSNGAHVLGLRALSTDNRTYAFFGANVTVGNSPLNTALPAISGTAQQGQTLSVSNGAWTNNPASFTYQWSRCNAAGSGCGSISGAVNNSYTVAAGDVNSTLRATVTASNAVGSASATSAQTALVAGLVNVTTTSLPTGQQNAGYNTTLAASGGTGSYTWSIIAGALPAGLNLATGTGVISGVPSGIGTSNFTVQAMDTNAQSGSKALSITVNGAAPVISMTQSNAVEGSAAGSLAVAFPAANTAHNLILVFVRMSSASQTVTVTDTAGNSYTDAVSQVQSADGHQIHLFYARDIQGKANTVTARFSATNNHPWLAIYEYSGLSTTSPLDRTASAQGGDASPNTGSTAVTNSPTELVFAGVGVLNYFSGTITPGAGYSLIRQDSGSSRAANENAVTSSSGAVSGTFSLSGSVNWSALVATFRP